MSRNRKSPFVDCYSVLLSCRSSSRSLFMPQSSTQVGVLLWPVSHKERSQSYPWTDDAVLRHLRLRHVRLLCAWDQAVDSRVTCV